jgi:hypothetical protein
MRTEAEVRERLARMESDLKDVRAAWMKALYNAPRGSHLWDEDPELLRGQMTAIESAIEELQWMLEDKED